MTRFVIGEPVATAEPAVVVDGTFKPGLHRFRLVVVDDSGRESRPDEAVVQVVESIRPIALPRRAGRRKPQ